MWIVCRQTPKIVVRLSALEISAMRKLSRNLLTGKGDEKSAAEKRAKGKPGRRAAARNPIEFSPVTNAAGRSARHYLRLKNFEARTAPPAAARAGIPSPSKGAGPVTGVARAGVAASTSNIVPSTILMSHFPLKRNVARLPPIPNRRSPIEALAISAASKRSMKPTLEKGGEGKEERT
jgi:hypothetical protein